MEYDDANVKCPYFISNYSEDQRAKLQIRCEGVSDGNCISLTFRNSSAIQAYKELNCNSLHGCKRCLIHNMLDRKYGVDDEI